MTRLEFILSTAAILIIMLFCFILFGFTNDYIYPIAHDGDTIINVDLATGKKIHYRLANIDAPELKQVYGTNSRDSLQNLINHSTVTYSRLTIDKYGRTVALIYINGLRYDSIAVANGWAYVYAKYCNYSKLFLIENRAKANHVGLWNLQPQQRPWDFRARNK